MVTYNIYETDINDGDVKNVTDCIKSGWVSWRGAYVSKFETMFSEYVKTRYAQTVSSGTAALHLALLAIGTKQGDEIILPDLAYIAAANAVKIVSATPIFIDSHIKDWNIDTKLIEEHITERTKAILVVHTLGAPCAMEEIMRIATKHNIGVIEDACESLGAKLNNKHLGTFGHIGVYSFFANKTITTGEGGMLVTNERALHDTAYKLKTQAVDPLRTYWHDMVGMNYRMTSLSAALGCSQLSRIDTILVKKASIAKWYREFLPGMCFQENLGLHSHWMIAANFKTDASSIAMKLGRLGVETRPMFYPATDMPVFYDNKGSTDRPVARTLSKQSLMLPSYPKLERADVEEICERIKEAR